MRKEMVSQVQSVIFERKYWTVTRARVWLRKHKLVHDGKVNAKPNTLHFRQSSPIKFKRFALKNKRVKPSVDLVLGFL
jgi:hypothetical protein